MHNTTYSNNIIFGYKKQFVLMRIWLGVSFHFVKKYKNPLSINRIRKEILSLKHIYTAEFGITKLAYVDGKYYFNSNMNGWPSPLFYRPLEVEVKKGLKEKVFHLENLKMVQIAMTKKCPLNCEHCFEGHELNKKDTLKLNDHKRIVEKLQNAGISVIQYGGGEPMTQINDLVEILKSATDKSDFYVYTSGFNCSKENLQKLKAAGLKGVSISFDHYIADKHNAFRRNNKAFDWALAAAKNASELNLVVTFTLCATKDFCTEINLWRYLDFAKENKADFVQVLEPRAAGNYENQDVHLSKEQLKMLENFFIDANSKSTYNMHPIVLYTGYHQRKKGCLGAGENYLYIDTDGYISSCPFCRNVKTHILDNSHEASIKELKLEGCSLPETKNYENV